MVRVAEEAQDISADNFGQERMAAQHYGKKLCRVPCGSSVLAIGKVHAMRNSSALHGCLQPE
eukprot:4163768-Amphidinium_carterae.2